MEQILRCRVRDGVQDLRRGGRVPDVVEPVRRPAKEEGRLEIPVVTDAGVEQRGDADIQVRVSAPPRLQDLRRVEDARRELAPVGGVPGQRLAEVLDRVPIDRAAEQEDPGRGAGSISLVCGVRLHGADCSSLACGLLLYSTNTAETYQA